MSRSYRPSAHIRPADGPPMSPLEMVMGNGKLGTVVIPTRRRRDPWQRRGVIETGKVRPDTFTWNRTGVAPGVDRMILPNPSESATGFPFAVPRRSPGNSFPSAGQPSPTLSTSRPWPCDFG